MIVDARSRWNLTPRQVQRLRRLQAFEDAATRELQTLRAGQLEHELLGAVVSLIRGRILAPRR